MNQQHSLARDDLQPVYPARVKVGQAEREANRAKLAEKIANATEAIIAPAGATVLEDVATLPRKPKEIEPMNEPAVHTNGASEGTAVAASPRRIRPHITNLPDETIREWHREYARLGQSLQMAAELHDVDQTGLRKRFQELGLAINPQRGGRPKAHNSGVKFDKATTRKGDRHPAPRQPSDLGGNHPDARHVYASPTITGVPLNGDGPHSEAAREMVAEYVGAQTVAETAVSLTPQEPVQTAVPLPGNIMAFLADMERVGGQVFITGEMNLNIRVTF